MATWVTLAAFLLGTSSPVLAASPSLAQAQQLYQDQKYKKVLPLLKKALREDPTPREQVDIYELMAMTHVVFGRTAKAREAFEQVLELNPDYEIPANASPKIRKAFRQAQKRAKKRRRPGPPNAVDESPAEPVGEDAPGAETDFDPFDTGETRSGGGDDGDIVDIPPPDASLESSNDEDSAFYQKWWFWTAVGVGVVGLGVGAAILFQPSEPASDFGPYPLP